MEPFYDAFEKLEGTSGKAGNVNGQKVKGGNMFEGPRKSQYPTRPMDQPYGPVLFAKAAEDMEYNTFPVPSSLLSEAYTNPLGVSLAPCTFCGFCTNYGCANYSKVNAFTCVVPSLMRKKNFKLYTDSNVLKVQLDSDGKKATGIIFIDEKGEQWEQPADIVVVSAFTFENVRLMLLSGVGEAYDPVTQKGTTGRNYAYQTANNVQLFFKDKNFNSFIGGGSIRAIPIGASPYCITSCASWHTKVGIRMEKSNG